MKPTNSLLVTRPRYDPTTEYCYHWSVPVIAKAKEKAFHVLDVIDTRVTLSILESYINKHRPQLLFFNGHGSPSVLAGQDDLPILHEKNIDLLPQHSLVYIRSCDVGSKLGRIIAKHASAFIGYAKSFGFYRMSKFMKQPRADPLAKFSFEPSNLVVTTLIKGKTAKEAHDRSKAAMKKTWNTYCQAKHLLQNASVLRRCGEIINIRLHSLSITTKNMLRPI